MPKRILLIGILYCLYGATAIFEVAAQLVQAHLEINFAVLLLPVGIGLLRGKPSSWKWAKIWIILGYALCGIGVCLSVLDSANLRAFQFGREITGSDAIPTMLGTALVVVTILVVIHLLLISEKSRAFFEKKSSVTEVPAAGATARVFPDQPNSRDRAYRR